MLHKISIYVFLLVSIFGFAQFQMVAARHDRAVSSPIATPSVVRWLCGGKYVNYSNGNLIVDSGSAQSIDGNFNAGFAVYSGSLSNLNAYPPGPLTLTVSGAQTGDQYQIFTKDVNSKSALLEFQGALTNGRESITISGPTRSNITYILFIVASNDHPVQISKISLNGKLLPIDLSHIDTCTN